MHILLLNDDCLPESQGGTAVVVDRLASAYAQEGHTVTLVTTHQDPSKGPKFEREGVVSLLSTYPAHKRHRHCLGDPKMREALAEVFEQLQPDAVHAHNIHAHLTYESLLIAKQFTDNIILTAHDVFLVAFARVAGSRFEQCALENKPFRMHFWEHLLSVGRKYYPLRNRTIRTILKKSGTKVVAISAAHKQFLEENGITVSSVIHNGTHLASPVSSSDVAAFRARLNLTGPTILFGGRLSDDKGASVLFSAFAQVREHVPDAQLLLVGEAKRIEELLDRVPTPVRDAIVTPGWLSREEMRTAYSSATVVTTPSLCFDPFNLMNIEAMAEAKPVVATFFGGAPEIIEDGTTGIIVYPRDIDAFAEALMSLLQDPELAEKMGVSGRARVERRFTVEKQSKEYLGLLADGIE